MPLHRQHPILRRRTTMLGHLRPCLLKNKVRDPPPEHKLARIAALLIAAADLGESSKKRPRSASDTGDDMHNTISVETVCRKLMNEMRAEWREDLKQMETGLKQWMDKRLSDCVEELHEELDQREGKVDEQIQEVRDEADDVIDVRIDDRMLGVKVELDEYVEEQMDNAEERLMNRLSTANVSIEFRIDD